MSESSDDSWIIPSCCFNAFVRHIAAEIRAESRKLLPQFSVFLRELFSLFFLYFWGRRSYRRPSLAWLDLFIFTSRVFPRLEIYSCESKTPRTAPKVQSNCAVISEFGGRVGAVVVFFLCLTQINGLHQFEQQRRAGPKRNHPPLPPYSAVSRRGLPIEA